MAAARRVVYVLERADTRIRHRSAACTYLSVGSPVTRLEVAAWDSVWELFNECLNCAKRGEPYELVEP